MVANRQLAEQPDNTMELRKAGFPIVFQINTFQVVTQKNTKVEETLLMQYIIRQG